ncbi:MAG: hypothetical protein AB1758_16075 [Candidatus Eremiobacterota bacterium]
MRRRRILGWGLAVAFVVLPWLMLLDLPSHLSRNVGLGLMIGIPSGLLAGLSLTLDQRA